MAAPATTETLRFQPQTPETINRCTDDPIFNVKYLYANIIDREQELFDPVAEQDVLEQDVSDIAESDVHGLGPKVEQKRDPLSGQYVSLGSGTVDHAVKGYKAIDPNDEKTRFELLFRREDIVTEESILEPWVNERMRAGEVRVQVCPPPTHNEADPDVAISLNYDGRTMIGLQWLSPDGEIKTMQTFSLFNTTAADWAKFLGERYDTAIEPTSLAVRQFCNRVILEQGSVNEILQVFIGGVIEHADDDQKHDITRQLDDFKNKQAELAKQATYYALEKQAFEKELALSYMGAARPKVLQAIHDVYPSLSPENQHELNKRYDGYQLTVDDFVAKLAIGIKTVTVDNRAGLATMNYHTVKRVASRMGIEAALEMAAREQAIQASTGPTDFMSRRNDQLIAESGLGCGGGCSVSFVDLFSSDAKTAREAGLDGKLYSADSLDKGSKCSCKKTGKRAKVISDGKNVVCVTCTEFDVGGKRGSLKPSTPKAA